MAKIKQKIVKGWSLTRKAFVCACIWGLVWSTVTIAGLRAGFDYDDTLVFSTPAFNKAFHSGALPFSPQFWTVVNQSYDLERPKLLPNAIAWALRICGFRLSILTARPPDGGEGLKKEWRHLASKFIFTGDPRHKHQYLNDGRYVLFFGDSDSDISESRLAHVMALRVLRSPSSSYKEDYHPGSLHELIIPLSQY